jgi:hypothetical protein
MNSIENFAGKAKTGIWGLDNILSGAASPLANRLTASREY